VNRQQILAAARAAAPASDVRVVAYTDQEYAEREAHAALAELAAAWRRKLSRPKRLDILQRWGVLVEGVSYDRHDPLPLVRRITLSRRGTIVTFNVDDGAAQTPDPVESEVDAWFGRAQQEDQ
jgi:hypothetical protein